MKTTFHTRRKLTKTDFAWLSWKPKDIERETKKTMSEIRFKIQKIKSIPDTKRTFGNTIAALDLAFGELTVAGQTANFLSKIWVLASTSPLPATQEFARVTEKEIRSTLIDLENDIGIYSAIEEYRARAKKLAPDKKLLLTTWVKRYTRKGFNLPKEKQALVTEYMKELSTLCTRFQNNIDDYQDHILVNRKELDGMSDNYIATLEKVGDKYKVGLSYPEAGPFLVRAKNRKARFALAEKNSKKGGRENLEVLWKMATLRHKIARLLGYRNHFAYRTELRMAKSEIAVKAFLDNIYTKVKKAAAVEQKILIARKNKDLGLRDKHIDAADAGYYTRLLGEETFSINGDKIREYFPLEHVRDQAFALFTQVFDLQFKKADLPKIHPDVQWYEVTTGKGVIMGYLCLDLFPRPKKYGHMCAEVMDISFFDESGKYRTPAGIMVGNFTKSTATNPSLLSHGEVTTFLHEMGHLVHGLTSNARFPSQHAFYTSIDFVEIPSQLFENWGWQTEVMVSMSKHYKTGESLPLDLIEKIKKTENFREATHSMGQLEFGYVDYALHTNIPKQNPNAIALALRKKLTKIVPAKGSLFPASFGHLREYDGGYYSYLWSLAIADDMWSRFKKEGILNQKTGLALRDDVLARGVSQDEEQLVKNFLGRKANNKAFLKRFS